MVFVQDGNSVVADPRYHRQTLLAQIGGVGQGRLASAHVLIVGCGALGAPAAEWLARAGVGTITIADRDVVEMTNLQRQTLFSESDAKGSVPKAIAAARRLGEINTDVRVRPAVVDVGAHNIDGLLVPTDPDVPPVGLILDGTDNVATRYLLNDAAVERGIPLVYGGAIATEGRQATFLTTPGPHRTACLRCAFGEPPPPASLPTCDTVGVLGPVAGVVAACQALDAIKVLTGNLEALSGSVLSFDAWANHRQRINIRGQQDPDCPCCGRRVFQFLRPVMTERHNGITASLCGRNAVQITPPTRITSTGRASTDTIDLTILAERLQRVGPMVQTPYMIRVTLGSVPRESRCASDEPLAGVAERLELTVFNDGRAIVSGTSDPAHARSLYDRFVGA